MRTSSTCTRCAVSCVTDKFEDMMKNADQRYAHMFLRSPSEIVYLANIPVDLNGEVSAEATQENKLRMIHLSFDGKHYEVHRHVV